MEAWKDKGFAHPTFKDIVSYSEGKRASTTQKPLPWHMMTVKCGGAEASKEMIDQGDMVSVPNPNNPSGPDWWMVVTKEIVTRQELQRTRRIGATATINDPNFLEVCVLFLTSGQGRFSVAPPLNNFIILRIQKRLLNI